MDTVFITGEARKMLEGETLVEAVRELVKCQKSLGFVNSDEKPTKGEERNLLDKVKSAVAEYALAQAELKGRATLRETVAFWKAKNPDGSAVIPPQLPRHRGLGDPQPPGDFRDDFPTFLCFQMMIRSLPIRR